jgi:hypothetical protein
MDNPFEGAIAALERRLGEVERKGNELRGAINALLEEAGQPPRYPTGVGDSIPSASGATSTTQPSVTALKPDTFYGKKQGTAVREYLEMRKARGLGPAKPREIYEALREGGYAFEAKDDTNALVGLRALLRKNTNQFHKLPTGAYGLMSWYPHAKRPRATGVAAEPESDSDLGDHQEPSATVLMLPDETKRNAA